MRDSVLQPDSPVEFEIATDSGRLQAKNVRLI